MTIRHSICHFCTRPKWTHRFSSKVGINRKDDNIWQCFTDNSQNTQRQQFNLTTTSARHTHVHSQSTVFLKVSDVPRIKPLQVITMLAPYYNTVNSLIQPVVESSHMRTHAYSLAHINAHINNACIKKSQSVCSCFLFFFKFSESKKNDWEVF